MYIHVFLHTVVYMIIYPFHFVILFKILMSKPQTLDKPVIYKKHVLDLISGALVQNDGNT